MIEINSWQKNPEISWKLTHKLDQTNQFETKKNKANKIPKIPKKYT